MLQCLVANAEVRAHRLYGRGDHDRDNVRARLRARDHARTCASAGAGSAAHTHCYLRLSAPAGRVLRLAASRALLPVAALQCAQARRRGTGASRQPLLTGPRCQRCIISGRSV